MNIWIDCEFNEFGGDLISMALVADDGQEFYEVLDLEKDWKYGSWVFANVVPWLNKDPIEKSVFQSKLWAFINQWDEVHIIADWPDDIKYFCMSLITGPGMAINTPLNLTMQIDRTLSTESSAILHNALEDARAIKRSWERWRKEAEGYGKPQPRGSQVEVVMDSMCCKYMIFGSILYDSGDMRYWDDMNNYQEIDLNDFTEQEKEYKEEFKKLYPDHYHLVGHPFKLINVIHYH